MYEVPRPCRIIRSNRRRTSIGAQYDDDRWMTKSFRHLFDSVLWVVSNSSLFCFLSVFRFFFFLIFLIIQQVFLSGKSTTSFTFSPSALSALSLLSFIFFSRQLRSTISFRREVKDTRLGQLWATATGFVFCSVGRFLVSLFRFPRPFSGFFRFVDFLNARAQITEYPVNEWIIDEWLLEWRFAIHFFFTLLVVFFF